jgi:ACR3 family arsenite transporter
MITRFVLRSRKGADWYDQRFMPRLGPTALLGLLFTIVVMFSMQGDKILARPLDVVRIAIPLVLYFLSMFGVTFLISWWRKLPYPLAISQSFTVGSINFELAIAVAVATFGIASPEALATVIGPLVEVPVLVSPVYVSLWLKRVFFDSEGRAKPVEFRPL